jgi:serine/threonine-protein kinase
MSTKKMVLVPAGTFLMGDDKHPVHVEDFYMDINPVTVGEFALFCQATGRKMPPSPRWGWVYDHPIVNVTWYDAEAYAKWVGKTLPTEAQWEKAARGTDGREYPWGNTWDSGLCWNYDNSPNETQPVGMLPKGASPYGCLDMSGNVCEWTDSWYDNNHNRRVLRGGAWYNNYVDYFRCLFRNYGVPDGWGYGFGFRCVSSSPESFPSTISTLEEELIKAKKALAEVEETIARYKG